MEGLQRLLPFGWPSCRASSRMAPSTSTSTSPRAASTQTPGRRPCTAGSPQSTCLGVSHPHCGDPLSRQWPPGLRGLAWLASKPMFTGQAEPCVQGGWDWGAGLKPHPPFVPVWILWTDRRGVGLEWSKGLLNRRRRCLHKGRWVDLCTVPCLVAVDAQK